jgi:hypothetical protein
MKLSILLRIFFLRMRKFVLNIQISLFKKQDVIFCVENFEVAGFPPDDVRYMHWHSSLLRPRKHYLKYTILKRPYDEN